MLYLFDTSALLAHYRREAGWQQVQAIFDDANADILLASVTLTEFARSLRELGANDAEARQTAEAYRLLVNDWWQLMNGWLSPLSTWPMPHPSACRWPIR